MKQLAWKKNIEDLEAEVLRRGLDPHASEILKRFGTGLSTTIHHFFAEPNSYNPENPLKVDHRSFTHSLQLYDVQSVIRLIANYDSSLGLKVVLPGIEKSVQSLMVVSQLKQFTKTEREKGALKAYQKRLEESLSRVLNCEHEELYSEDVLAEKMVEASGAHVNLLNGFFSERLRALFSVNYRFYLILKNRYFLNRLVRSQKNPQILNWQKFRLKKLIDHYQKNDDSGDSELKEELDFRIMEHLVKEQIMKYGDRAKKKEQPQAILKTKTQAKEASENKTPVSQEATVDAKIKLKEKSKTRFEVPELKTKKEETTFIKIFEPDPLEAATPYEKLFAQYQAPIELISSNFKPIDESTAPFFKARSEQYTSDFSEFFRKIFLDHPEVIAANRHFALDLLEQRGREYHAVERWSVVEKQDHDVESAYLRNAPGVAPIMDRKSEWSLSMQTRLPFKVRFPLEEGRIVNLEKNRACIFQLGTSFFDQDHLNERDEQPDGFFKLMFGGHVLTHKTSVIYSGNKPFFTLTKQQTWLCRGLVFVLLMAASHRFALELSPSLQNFLVEVVPNVIHVNGAMRLKAPLPKFLETGSEEQL